MVTESVWNYIISKLPIGLVVSMLSLTDEAQLDTLLLAPALSPRLDVIRRVLVTLDRNGIDDPGTILTWFASTKHELGGQTPAALLADSTWTHEDDQIPQAVIELAKQTTTLHSV